MTKLNHIHTAAESAAAGNPVSGPATASNGPTAGATTRSFTARMYGLLVIQFALLVLLIFRFEIEGPAFRQLSILTGIGFAVHCLLPLRHRLRFFLALSLGGIVLTLGPIPALWLVGMGLLLIGICHLPIPFPARIAGLLAVGAAFAAFRAFPESAPWLAALWPILGSIFMFRLAVYLYDLRYNYSPVGPVRRLSYFFILPNVCFPLFPVIDYKTYCQTYYNEDEFLIYQRGITWIFRGLVHLLLYRFVYHYLTIEASEVATPLELVQFLTHGFLLYLRVSGQFHIIVGMLHLFGFNLPETHHRYYLANSFTDFWRRINIYWKDFMMKLFFYPIYFRLRRYGATMALVVSTCLVFFATWVLHSYQWFWIRGSFPVVLQDVLFWGILGVLVVVNVVYENKYGRRRSLSGAKPGLATSIATAFKTLGVFVLICVLWSLWTSSSVSGWLSAWSAVIVRPDMTTVAVVLLAAAGFTAVAALIDRFPSPLQPRREKLHYSAYAVIASILVILPISVRSFTVHLDSRLETVATLIREHKLNERHTDMLERGYYEDLMDVHRFNEELWSLYATKKPTDWTQLSKTDAAESTNDLRGYVLKPNVQLEFKRAAFTTNRWGMRDEDYPLQRQEGVCRWIFLGGSHVMGTGVGDGEMFEAVLEERINQEFGADKCEILNFSLGAYYALQCLSMFEHKACEFEPDAVFLFIHPGDTRRVARDLVSKNREGADLEYPFLYDMLRNANVDKNTPESMALRQMKPYREELLLWTYKKVAKRCREHGAEPVAVLLPLLEFKDEADAARVKELAQQAQFRLIDLTGVYAGRDHSQLTVAEWDRHPNASGHQLVADRLYEELSKSDMLAPFHPALSNRAADNDTLAGIYLPLERKRRR